MNRRRQTEAGSDYDVAAADHHASAMELLELAKEAVLNDPEAVPELASRAERFAADRGDDRSRAIAALVRALSGISLSRFADALAAADEAAGIFRRIEDARGEAEALNLAGRIRIFLGDPERALEECGRALAIAVTIGDRDQECHALLNRAIAMQLLGSYAESLEIVNRALAIARELGENDRIVSIMMTVGNALRMLGSYHDALEEFRKGLALAIASGNLRMQAQASGNAGVMLERLGDFPGALDYHHRAIAFNEKLGEGPGLAASHNNIAIIYQRLGEFAPALEHFLKALAIAGRIGDAEGELTTLANIGGLYEVLGARGRVLEYYQRSRAISEQSGNRQGEANALLLIGRYHMYASDHQNALLHFFRALRMYEQSGDTYGRVSALRMIGSALRTIGDLDRAEPFLDEAIEQAAGNGDRIGELVASAELGRLRTDRGDAKAAIAILEDVVDGARAIDAREIVRRTLEALAEACRAAGQSSRASVHEQEAREILRTMFDSESSHRISVLMSDFERTNIEMHGAEMGVSREDLDVIASVLSRRTPAVETSRTPAPPVIRVTTFGELGVSIGGRQLTAADWKRKRPRDLFKLLLLHYRRPVSLDTIVESLGGEIGSRGAELVVMNSVSHIRRALEPERAPRDRTTYLRLSDGAYLLDLGKEAEIDFIRFKELVASARRASAAEERRRHYEEAIALYRDDFLKEDYNAPWTDAERSALRDAWLEALEFVASEQLRQERFDEAIATARRILGHDGVSTRAFEVLLQGLVSRGRHVEARTAAISMETAFRETLGTAPPAGLMGIVGGSI